MDRHDARKRMISPGQSSRSGTRGRELHIARWGRAVSQFPLIPSAFLAGSVATAAAVSMMQLWVPVVISLGSLGKKNSGLYF